MARPRAAAEPLDLVIVNGYTSAPTSKPRRRRGARGIPTGLRLDSVLWDGGAPRRALAKRLLFTGYLKRMYDLFFGVGTLTLDYLRFFGVPCRARRSLPLRVDVESFRRAPTSHRRPRRGARPPPGAARRPPAPRVTKLAPREAPWEPAARRSFRLRAGPLGGDRRRRPGAPETKPRARPRARTLRLALRPLSELASLYAAADLSPPVQKRALGVSVAEGHGLRPAGRHPRRGWARPRTSSPPVRNGFTYPRATPAPSPDASKTRCASTRPRCGGRTAPSSRTGNYAAAGAASSPPPHASGDPTLNDARVPPVPLTVLFPPPEQEANIERSLASVHGFADQIFVLARSEDRPSRSPPLRRRGAEPRLRARPHHSGIFQWGARQPADPQRMGV